MKFSNALRSTLSTTLLALLIAASPTASQAAVELYAKGAIPGTAADTSGLSGNLSDGTPHNRMGGFGSAITYTGIGNSFIAVPDRGPADGTTNYLDRYYTLDIPLTAGVITPALKSTVLLRDQEGRNLTGSAAAFDTTTPTSSLRFDPEGVRVAYNRKIYISDEYGPYIHEFDSNGTRTRTIRIPDKFAIANPSAPFRICPTWSGLFVLGDKYSTIIFFPASSSELPNASPFSSISPITVPNKISFFILTFKYGPATPTDLIVPSKEIFFTTFIAISAGLISNSLASKKNATAKSPNETLGGNSSFIPEGFFENAASYAVSTISTVSFFNSLIFMSSIKLLF